VGALSQLTAVPVVVLLVVAPVVVLVVLPVGVLVGVLVVLPVGVLVGVPVGVLPAPPVVVELVVLAPVTAPLPPRSGCCWWRQAQDLPSSQAQGLLLAS